MDDYDLRRLWSYKNNTLRLSQEDAAALSAIEAHVPSNEAASTFADQGAVREFASEPVESRSPWVG